MSATLEAIPTCDLCNKPEGEGEADWNGETGNHATCEENERRLQVTCDDCGWPMDSHNPLVEH